MGNNRLRELRNSLRDRKTELQRSYNFRFRSTKLFIGQADLKIISIEHPFFNFENIGDYRGYINAVTKPTEITITFLEDDKLSVTGLMDFWDSLKWNSSTGIKYPKAVYEDQGILTYEGADYTGEGKVRTRAYAIKGIYPLTRPNTMLSYDQNDIVKITVPFNVDDVSSLKLFGALKDFSRNIFGGIKK